ncbi:MAG: hypothetical protein C5B45_06475 [Chlamydiae bacterium]|nr:MAG: hypothetical protein C5B45_06475 [Chlamydiota bacterium]
MNPVNNYTNEIPPPLSDALLKEKYGGCPELLPLAICLNQSSQAMDRINQAEERQANKLIKLIEDRKALHTETVSLIELSEKNTQALRRLEKLSSEIKAITPNIANVVSICANRIFNPVKNGLQSGFYFLTGHRAPLAVFPEENQLAIEYQSENKTSNIDPINQSSIDEKKKCANLLKFCMVVGGLYVLHSKVQSIFFCSYAISQTK